MEDNKTIRFKGVYISHNIIFVILLLGQGHRRKHCSQAFGIVSEVSLIGSNWSTPQLEYLESVEPDRNTTLSRCICIPALAGRKRLVLVHFCQKVFLKPSFAKYSSRLTDRNVKSGKKTSVKIHIEQNQPILYQMLSLNPYKVLQKMTEG